MQVFKTLAILAAMALVSVNAGANQEQEQQQYLQNSDSNSDSASDDNTPTPTEKGYSIKEINFQSGDIKEAEENEEQDSNSTWPVVGAIGACAVVGALAAVYVKRRSDEDKLPGEIFTVDDKNSVL